MSGRRGEDIEVRPWAGDAGDAGAQQRTHAGRGDARGAWGGERGPGREVWTRGVDPGVRWTGADRRVVSARKEGTQILGSRPGVSLPLMGTSWCTASVEPLDAARATPHRRAA
jgi:hypothetical protein